MKGPAITSPEIKICGLSTPETLESALTAGADYVGFVFFPKSPRHVTLEQARLLAGMARGRARIVALTVDADDAQLETIAEAVTPDFFQAHGRETPERIAAIFQRFSIPLIKAIAVSGQNDLVRAASYDGAAEFLLLDAAPPSRPDALPGGNGTSFDWSLLKGARLPARWMLSGGLSPETVGAGLLATGAPMVDVSSGVETAPGVKDHGLIGKFIEAARRAR